jgi:hypothetical protein
MAEWEAEIKIRRNGRLVKVERALGDNPEAALYAVHNDFELWAQVVRGRLARVRTGGQRMKASLKVERRALDIGAHQACIDAGPDAACAPCKMRMEAAFDYWYGVIAPERLRMRIAADLAAEGRLFGQEAEHG